MTDISEQKFDPNRLKKAHRLMEWSNIIVIACSALSITAWFTAHFVLFYILGSFALVLSLIFAWGPVFLGLSGPGEGRIVNGILFIVIGILITHRFWAGLLLGGCFFGLFNMAPLAVDLYKMRRDKKNKEGSDVCEEPAPVMEEGRDDLMHTFEELQDKFAADPDLELKLQD